MKTNIKNPPKTEKQVRFIIEDRLSLQSTKRELEFHYRVPQVSLKYFESVGFAQIFDKWDESKKNNFLQRVGGPYCNYLQKLIEKNKVLVD